MWGAVPAAAASTSASSSTSTKTSMGARLLKPQHDWLRIFLSSSALSFESTHSRFVLWLSTRSSLTIKCRTKARLSAAQLSPPRRATYPTSRCEPAGATGDRPRRGRRDAERGAAAAAPRDRSNRVARGGSRTQPGLGPTLGITRRARPICQLVNASTATRSAGVLAHCTLAPGSSRPSAGSLTGSPPLRLAFVSDAPLTSVRG